MLQIRQAQCRRDSILYDHGDADKTRQYVEGHVQRSHGGAHGPRRLDSYRQKRVSIVASAVVLFECVSREMQILFYILITNQNAIYGFCFLRKHFGTVLNYLRDGTAPLPEQRQELEELVAEAKYFLVSELVAQAEDALRQKDDEVTPICR